jgi:hypothetical protein
MSDDDDNDEVVGDDGVRNTIGVGDEVGNDDGDNDDDDDDDDDDSEVRGDDDVGEFGSKRLCRASGDGTISNSSEPSSI